MQRLFDKELDNQHEEPLLLSQVGARGRAPFAVPQHRLIGTSS